MKRVSLIAATILAALLLGLAGSAFAVITTFTPAPSVVNPVTNDLFVVNNGGASPIITRYSWDNTTHDWTTPGTGTTLTSGSKCYGLAVSPDGSKLFVSLAQGPASAVKVYTLSGWPSSVATMTGASWASTSAPAGLVVAPNGNLYVADKGIGRLLVFSASANSYVSQITDHLSGRTNLYDVAVSPADGSGNFKIFVTQKADAGQVFVFNQAGTWVRTLDQATYPELSYPLYAKYLNDKLYVSVNGNGGSDVDILVFNSDGSALTGKVKSGVTGEFGWTPFDFTANGAWLIFKKANNAAETSNTIYKVQISSITAGGVTAASAVTGVIGSDGLGVVTYRANPSTQQNVVALGDSRTGTMQTYNPVISNSVSNPTNLQQQTSTGVAIPAGGTIATNTINLSATLTDPDSDQVYGRFKYHRIGGADSFVNSSLVNSGASAAITLAGLADGNYQWYVKAIDPSGNESSYVKFSGTGANVDFIVKVLVSIDVAPLSATITHSGTRQFTATGTYADGSTADLTTAVTWASSSTGVATINTAGLATSVAAGTTNITATLGAIVSPARVLTVNAPVLVSIDVTPASPTITHSGTQQFIATGRYSDSSTANLTTAVTWASSSTGVATINTAGLASSVAAGTTNITATLSGVTSPASVLVVVNIADTTPPSPVTNFTATPDNAGGAINLSWANPVDADLAGVRIIRSTTNDPSAGSVVFEGTGTTFSDTGLDPAQNYYYFAVTYDEVPNYSAPVAAVPSPVSPYAGPAPTIDAGGLTPDNGVQGQTVTIINLRGANFRAGVSVQLTRAGEISREPVINSITRISSSIITCAFNLTGAALGAWNVVVTNTDTSSATLADGFTVTTPGLEPGNLVVTPTEGVVSLPLVVTIAGDNLGSTDPHVVLARIDGTDIAAVVTVNPDGSLSADFGTLPAGMLTGDWTLLITNDVPATTAVPFTIRAEAAVITVALPQIARAGDIVRDAINLSWTTNRDAIASPGEPVDIYVLERQADINGNYGAYFSTAPTDWSIWLQNYAGNSTSDTSQVGQGTQKYYKIVPTGTALTTALLSTDVVGKFDIQVGPPDTHPERAFISLPLEQSDNSVASVIGNQATESDSLVIIDNNYGIVAGMLYEGGRWIEIADIPPINNLTQGQAYLYTGLSPKHFSIVGKVRDTSNTKTIVTGLTPDSQFVLDWIGTAFPSPIALSSAGLEGTNTGPDALSASAIVYLDANAGIIGEQNGYAEHRGTNNWVDYNESPAALQLIPGRGYMFTDPIHTTYEWTQGRP